MALRGKGMIVATAAGGAIGVFLSPVVRPAIARDTRPALKAAMRAGLLLYEQGREATAELGEMVEDIAVELKAERNGRDLMPKRLRRRWPPLSVEALDREAKAHPVHGILGRAVQNP